MSDPVQTLERWLDRGEKWAIPTRDFAPAVRSVLESLDLQSGANAKLLAKNLRLEAENERLRAEVTRTQAERTTYWLRIEAALALHKEQAWSGRCEVCDRAWPCPTVKALKGEKP